MTTVSKDAPQSESARKSNQAGQPGGLPVWLKVILSLLFIFHLTGVFIAPLNSSIQESLFLDLQRQAPGPNTGQPAVQQASYDGTETVYVAQGVEGAELLTPAADPLSELAAAEGDAQALTLYQLYEPYLNVLYLNHGYGFFSPNPSPSHLIRYRIENHDGSSVEGVFPNLRSPEHPLLKKETVAEVHWPRLRYHRHFMLAEQMIEQTAEGLPFSGKTYAQHLYESHHAKRVHIDYIEHRIPSPAEFRGGRKLDDPTSYVVLGRLTYPDDFPTEMKQEWESAP